MVHELSSLDSSHWLTVLVRTAYLLLLLLTSGDTLMHIWLCKTRFCLGQMAHQRLSPLQQKEEKEM